MDRGSLKAHQLSKYAAKPSKEKRRKGDLNPVCDRQQAWADLLLLMKRPATLTCPGITLLVHQTTTLRDYPNHGMPFTHINPPISNFFSCYSIMSFLVARLKCWFKSIQMLFLSPPFLFSIFL